MATCSRCTSASREKARSSGRCGSTPPRTIRWAACEAMQRIRVLRDEFWSDVYVAGKGADLNQALEHAGRVADFFEFAELMCHDALHREESCGCHFREEHQTPEGEAKRDDERFGYVAAWEFRGVGEPAVLHKEPLEFETVHLAQRSYK